MGGIIKMPYLNDKKTEVVVSSEDMQRIKSYIRRLEVVVGILTIIVILSLNT